MWSAPLHTIDVKYWTGQKLHSGLSITSYRNRQANFLTNPIFVSFRVLPAKRWSVQMKSWRRVQQGTVSQGVGRCREIVGGRAGPQRSEKRTIVKPERTCKGSRKERERWIQWNTSIMCQIHSGRGEEINPPPHPPLPFLGPLLARLTWKPESTETCGYDSYLSTSGKTKKSGSVESRPRQTEVIQPSTVLSNLQDSLIPHPPWIIILHGKQSYGFTDFWAWGNFESTNPFGMHKTSLKDPQQVAIYLNASRDREITACHSLPN